jgi:ssRNA-specific RNase YbeY (16S rRNA maturation enzyme)
MKNQSNTKGVNSKNQTHEIINTSKNEKEKKRTRFEIRLTEDEYIRLLQNAEDCKNVTAYILESCLSDKKRPYKLTGEVLKALDKTQLELNRIGKNINQTTKHINFLMQHSLINEDVFKRHQTDMLKYTNALIALEERLAKFIKG